MKRSLLIGAAALLTITSLASAETFSGTVTARRSVEVYAPIGGTVQTVNVSVGDSIAADASIASLDVTKVYASESGTITGVFAQPGDDAETIASRYGAVMYIEGESVYTISASTDNAYSSTATHFVHIGETVYLSCYSNANHTGTGVITAIEGTDYTVDVTSGSFLVPETINIYRGTSAVNSNRIGRGTLTRKNTTPVTGSGAIVSIEVNDGDHIEKGQLLMTTLNGSYDGYYMSGTEITSDISGTVASLNVNAGTMVEKGAVAAVIYPEGEMRIEAEISEYDLSEISVGDKVTVELLWNQDSDVRYEGVVTMISAIATESAQSGAADTEDSVTTYTVYVDFTPDPSTRYGMSAVISTIDEAEPVYDEAIADEIDEDSGDMPEFAPDNMPEFDRANKPAGRS